MKIKDRSQNKFDDYVTVKFKKAGRFEKLLGFARGSVSLSCATTPHPAFLNLNGTNFQAG